MLISLCRQYFPLSKADAMAEKIGYPPFILNDTALDESYNAVSSMKRVKTLSYFKLSSLIMICF